MKKNLGSSVLKKIIMSISGLFLIIFLFVHLGLNLLLFAGEEHFNEAAHFMSTNTLMQILQPMLAIGFLVHIFYGIILSYQNLRARPVPYKVVNQWNSSSWASRNMIYTGTFILFFLIVHLKNFFYVIKFGNIPVFTTTTGEEIENTYLIVVSLFQIWYFSILYIIGYILLGIHLSHALQSAFQSIGLNGDKTEKIWKFCSNTYAVFITIGFSVITIYFWLKTI